MVWLDICSWATSRCSGSQSGTRTCSRRPKKPPLSLPWHHKQVGRSRLCIAIKAVFHLCRWIHVCQSCRSVLDFDFEKLCSISLSHINVYACLICGKYFQGRQIDILTGDQRPCSICTDLCGFCFVFCRKRSEVSRVHSQRTVYPSCVPQSAYTQVLLSAR